jgi:hypothetical protein
MHFASDVLFAFLRFSTASESLDDLKRKLDVEHTSISSKLEQGAAARQELQDLKGAILLYACAHCPRTPLTCFKRQNYGGSRAEQGIPCQALGKIGKQGTTTYCMC